MTGLIVGELTIGQREVKDPAVERLEAKISETTTGEEPQEETTEERDYRGNDSPWNRSGDDRIGTARYGFGSRF